MDYLTIEQAARDVRVPVDRVMRLVKAGLLELVQKGNLVFVSTKEVYKLRFILYLQREHHLGIPEIERILQTHKPPFSDWRSEVGTI